METCSSGQVPTLEPTEPLSFGEEPLTFEELFQAEEFASMRAGLEDLELIEFLSNPNALFTIFAPTNEAFSLLEDVEETFFDCLKEHQPEVAISLMIYHFASGEFLAENLSNDQRIFMGAGRQSIVINIEDDESVMINENAQIVSPNLMASNGVLHKIDQVLFPASTWYLFVYVSLCTYVVRKRFPFLFCFSFFFKSRLICLSIPFFFH